jgi:hypothetical protein
MSGFTPMGKSATAFRVAARFLQVLAGAIAG